jgi:aspartate/methionine/tyrosine aminotransferase
MSLNPQALELNAAIQKAAPHFLDILSERGKAVFFPRKGILGQTADAKKCRINATIGAALEDDGKTMCLPSLSDLISLPEGDVFPYMSSFGHEGLRSRWKEMMLQKNPSLARVNISKPVVTSALTHGLSMGAYLFVNPGDTIVLPDKYWGNYNLIFKNGYDARFETFDTFTEDKAFNIGGLRNALSSGEKGKKILLLNFPNNPTGYTPTEQEGAAIRDALVAAADEGNTIVAFIDDAYFGLGYEPGILRESMFGLLAGAHRRILACKFDGPTKEDYVWGFRVGFVTFGSQAGTPELYAALEAKLGGAVRGNVSNVSHPAQSMLMRAYQSESYEAEKRQKFEVLKRRYDRIREVLATHKEYGEYFEPLPFNSGYFMCIELKDLDGEAVRQRLLSHYDTGVIAIGPILRLAFSSTPLSRIDELFEMIYQACADVRRSG